MKVRSFLLMAGTFFVSSMYAATYSCEGQGQGSKNAPQGSRDSEGYYIPRREAREERREKREERREERRNARDEDSDDSSDDEDNDSDNGDEQEGRRFDPADRELVKRIRMALESSGAAGQYRDVDIHVQGRVVRLRGNVENEQERQQLKNRIKNVEGIKKVEDRLQLKEQSGSPSSPKNDAVSDSSGNRPSPKSYGDRSSTGDRSSRSEDRSTDSTQNPDAQIKQKIRDSLKEGFFGKGYENVQAEVNNGVVVLKGTVDSESSRRDVMEKVAKINGIKKIDNQIKIVDKS